MKLVTEFHEIRFWALLYILPVRSSVDRLVKKMFLSKFFAVHCRKCS